MQLDRWIAGVLAVALMPAWACGAEESMAAEIDAADDLRAEMCLVPR